MLDVDVGRWSAASMPFSVARSVLDLLAPPRCLACRRRAPMPWCPACAAEVRVLPAGCSRCAAPRVRGHPCWPSSAPIDGTIAVYDYRGPVATAVVTAKLHGAVAGWVPLGRALAMTVEAEHPDVDLVTWVTTPGVRVRSRGIDHARVLAAAVADRLDLPVLHALDAVQAPDGRDHYEALIDLPGSNVLLIDDVVTTGTTAVRAATALRRTGAGRIVLAVLARAGAHPLNGVGQARMARISGPSPQARW